MRRETYQDGVLIGVEDLPDEVPAVVSARQLKRALLAAELYDAIDYWVGTQSRAIQIDWEYATEYRRDHPLLNAAAMSFGLTSAQIDALFVDAGKVD